MKTGTHKKEQVLVKTMHNVDALAALEAEVQQASLPLKESATQLVFGKGNPEADIVFIGEAPGAKEDATGVPFVGAAGKQLDTLLRSIGLTVSDVYICNILKYRPPENRDPLPEEIAAHTPYLVRQLAILSPRVIVTLGNYATRFILGGMTVRGMKAIPGITALHGSVRSVTRDEQTYTVMPMYHPAAMLYNGSLRTVLQEDFRILGALIGSTGRTGDVQTRLLE